MAYIPLCLDVFYTISTPLRNVKFCKDLVSARHKILICISSKKGVT